jgi:hypothetical protein
MIFCANIEILLLCLWTLWLLCFEVQSLAQGVGWLNDSQVHSNSLAAHARSLLPGRFAFYLAHPIRSIVSRQLPLRSTATLAA